MLLVQSSIWANRDTILHLAFDATALGLQSCGNKTSLSDAIFAPSTHKRTTC